MTDERNQQPMNGQEGYQPQIIQKGYQPQGQRGYQPQTNMPLDPLKLVAPQGGSAVQPSQAANSSSGSKK